MNVFKAGSKLSNQKTLFDVGCTRTVSSQKYCEGQLPYDLRLPATRGNDVNRANNAAVIDISSDDDDQMLIQALEEAEARYGLQACSVSPSNSSAKRPNGTYEAKVESICAGFDEDCGNTWIYPVNLPKRNYQFNITATALFNNTLVTLPTGLGKTFIGSVVMFNFYRWYPSGKVVFMAPTRPLVAQQIQACYGIVDIARCDMVEMTGSMSPAERQHQWDSKRVFFLTPQVMMNDLLRSACQATTIKCLVIDEAHRALGNHAYCQVVREIMKYTHEFRVLALSATPGSDGKTVQQIISNLLISRMELRTEDSMDVKPYGFTRSIEKIVVPLSDDHRRLLAEIQKVMSVHLDKLLRYKVISYGDVKMWSPFMLLKQRDQFRKAPPKGTSKICMGVVEGTFAVLINLYHGYELLNGHGMQAFFRYAKGTLDGEKSNPRVRSELRRSPEFAEILRYLEQRFGKKDLVDVAFNASCDGRVFSQIVGSGVSASLSTSVVDNTTASESHPKLTKLLQILLQHFEDACRGATSTRVIVFSQYRDSVQEITQMLNQHGPLIKAMKFVGQADGKGKCNRGFSQKEQLKVVRDFKDGNYNTLVSTCIGEEGLDIGDVDLIVCYDVTTSPTRLVQRMGRTGRKRKGRVVVLVAEGKEDKKYTQCEYSKGNVQKQIGSNKNFMFYKRSPRMVPTTVRPKCIELAVAHSQPFDNAARHCKKSGAAVALASSKKSGHLNSLQMRIWDLNFKPCAKELQKIKRLPPIGKLLSLKTASSDLLAERVLGPTRAVSCVNLAECSPWQTTVNAFGSVGASARCTALVHCVKAIHLSANEEPEVLVSDDLTALEALLQPAKEANLASSGSFGIKRFLRPGIGLSWTKRTRSVAQCSVLRNSRKRRRCKTFAEKQAAVLHAESDSDCQILAEITKYKRSDFVRTGGLRARDSAASSNPLFNVRPLIRQLEMRGDLIDQFESDDVASEIFDIFVDELDKRMVESGRLSPTSICPAEELLLNLSADLDVTDDAGFFVCQLLTTELPEDAKEAALPAILPLFVNAESGVVGEIDDYKRKQVNTICGGDGEFTASEDDLREQRGNSGLDRKFAQTAIDDVLRYQRGDVAEAMPSSGPSDSQGDLSDDATQPVEVFLEAWVAKQDKPYTLAEAAAAAKFEFSPHKAQKGTEDSDSCSSSSDGGATLSPGSPKFEAAEAVSLERNQQQTSNDRFIAEIRAWQKESAQKLSSDGFFFSAINRNNADDDSGSRSPILFSDGSDDETTLSPEKDANDGRAERDALGLISAGHADLSLSPDDTAAAPVFQTSTPRKRPIAKNISANTTSGNDAASTSPDSSPVVSRNRQLRNHRLINESDSDPDIPPSTSRSLSARGAQTVDKGSHKAKRMKFDNEFVAFEASVELHSSDSSSDEIEDALSQWDDSFVDFSSQPQFETQNPISTQAMHAIYLESVKDANFGRHNKFLFHGAKPDVAADTIVRSSASLVAFSETADDEYEFDSFCVPNDYVSFVDKADVTLPPSVSSHGGDGAAHTLFGATTKSGVRRRLRAIDSDDSEDDRKGDNAIVMSEKAKSDALTVKSNHTSYLATSFVDSCLPKAASSSARDDKTVQLPTTASSSWNRSTLASSSGGEQCFLLMDSQELMKTQDLAGLIRCKHAIAVSVCHLAECSYILSKRMAVDRRAYAEFCNQRNRTSIIRHLKRMKTLYSSTVLILETEHLKTTALDGRNYCQFDHSRCSDSLSIELAQMKVRVLYSRSRDDTATLLAELLRLENSFGFALEMAAPPTDSLLKTTRIFRGIPDVSFVVALHMALKCKSLSHLCSSNIEELCPERSISTERANKIRKFLRRSFKHDILLRS